MAQAYLRDMASEDLAPVKEQPLTAADVERDLSHFKVNSEHVLFIVNEKLKYYALMYLSEPFKYKNKNGFWLESLLLMAGFNKSTSYIIK